MKMKGFTCQSQASTAVVCMAHDRRSVLVPRLRATDRSLADQAMLIGGRRKCVRLGDVKRAESTGARSFGVTYLRKGGESKAGIARNDSIAISSGQVFQVVVMRVSLHCEGCAGKLKKHLSKMEGVTSFSIELENKKVTVMGNVSPSRVLESISKVKRAEFWPNSSL